MLSDIYLSVEKRPILALIGPTGSGKTTLLRIIDLLDEPTSGQLIFDEIDMTKSSEREKLKARRRMAMVFQKPTMFRSNVLENVKYGLKIRGLKGKDKGMNALESVGLSGYERRDANTLSGGEMQRLALARAIVVEPELLLLDEPTSDARTFQEDLSAAYISLVAAISPIGHQELNIPGLLPLESNATRLRGIWFESS